MKFVQFNIYIKQSQTNINIPYDFSTKINIDYKV